jgi:predicted  nucleic acid-binding Zn-ribbon protein
MAITAELNETKAALESEQLKLVETSKLISGLEVKLADTTKALDTASAEILVLKDSAVKVQAEIIAEKSAHEATKAELATAKAALANPAFAAAAAQGDKQAVKEGGAEASHVMTKAEALVEYKKLNDPVAEACFRRDHAKILGLA